MRLSRADGTFYRIVFTHDAPRLLDGVHSPEGRFHHSGQPALYMSPSPEAAAFAVATYLQPSDPPRVTARLRLTGARVVDLRDNDTLAALGLTNEPSVEWQPERAQGLPATSWRASDAARATGADGMIYTSRKVPSRWHLVLFRWNQPGGALVELATAPVNWTPLPISL